MQKLNWFFVEKKLKELNKKIFTPQDIMLFFNVKERAVQAFLSYNARKGKLSRLKKGSYSLKGEYISPYIIANFIYQPSYISFETALSYHGLIPETVYSMTSVTCKPTREFEVLGISYKYHKIKREAFTGYIPQKIEGEIVLIATSEKALADYVYFIYLGKKTWNNRTDIRKINLAQLRKYIPLFGKEKLLSFIKKYIPNI